MNDIKSGSGCHVGAQKIYGNAALIKLDGFMFKLNNLSLSHMFCDLSESAERKILALFKS